MIVRAYTRVSTLVQAQEGDSLQAQRERIEAYCRQERLTLAQVYEEGGVSGGIRFRDRPEGGALLAAVRPGDLIISAKLDRCWRDCRDSLDTLAFLKEKRVGLVLLDLGGNIVSGGIAALIFTVMSAFATFEKDRISERIREAKEVEKRQGRFRGGARAPFGFRIGADRMLEPIPEEQAGLGMMLRMTAEGHSLRRIKTALHEALGIRVSLSAIARVVREARITTPAA